MATAIAIPPATTPSILFITPVCTAPALDVEDEAVLPVAVVTVFWAAVPVVATVVAVEEPVLAAVANSALPVIVPGPWGPVAVKYRLMAVWLGYKSVVPVAEPVAANPSLRLLKICVKSAVGVPVQRMLDAEVMMELKAVKTAPERPPCTYSQSRQPGRW